MTPDALGACLRDALAEARPVPEPPALLARAAREILTMAASYCRDGDHFLLAGDDLNGCASFAYGHGWLDCGVRVGLVRPAPTLRGPVTIPKHLSSGESDRLMEKRDRYERMLDAALDAVEEVGAPGTPARTAGNAAVRVAMHCLRRSRGPFPAAYTLALLCYGYGWLDCAVRIGVLSPGNRTDLFPI